MLIISEICMVMNSVRKGKPGFAPATHFLGQRWIPGSCQVKNIKSTRDQTQDEKGNAAVARERS